jgi:hypothetical protein
MSEDRIRVGGLWAKPTRIGTILKGSITSAHLRKVATDADDLGDPLELVVFENTRGGDRSPSHTLFVAKRRPREDGEQHTKEKKAEPPNEEWQAGEDF